jgi:hypothetical protein
LDGIDGKVKGGEKAEPPPLSSGRREARAQSKGFEEVREAA